MRFLIIIYLFFQVLPSFIAFHIDPSDFFTGSKPTPRLEITSPENGQILEEDSLEIKISIKGYEYPSNFHHSSICVGLSTGDTFMEDCFDQPEVLSFHVNGLQVGAQYSLRVILNERNKAIAVSVRNFKVGGILGVVENQEQVNKHSIYLKILK